MSARGYFGIGIQNGKKTMNVGTLWRSAYIFGAAFIFTIGNRYQRQSSDTVKAPRHIPLHHYPTFADFMAARPFDCPLVGVEIEPGAVELPRFHHPERAVYLLGAEDHGLSKEAVAACQSLIAIPSRMCLNVAVAGSIVMYDRQTKRARATRKAAA